MKRTPLHITSGSTMFARAVVYLIGISALAVLLVLLPELTREEAVGKPSDLTVPALITAYILATPFFVALYTALRFLHNIDKNKVFSLESITLLRKIKYCAMAFTFMFAVAVASWVSFLKSMDPTEDMPPFILFGFIITFISVVIIFFIALLQKLLADAVALKSENDLIV